MAKEAVKPKYGFSLSLIGGLVMLIWGVLGIAGITLGFSLLSSIDKRLLGLASWFWGVSVLLFSYAMYGGPFPVDGKLFQSDPWKWGGIIVVILAFLNAIVGFDLYFLGSILALIGGIVGITGR